MRNVDHYLICFDLDRAIAEKAKKKLQKYNLTISDGFLRFLHYCSEHKDYLEKCLKEENGKPSLISNYQEIPVYDNETDDEAKERLRKEHGNDAGRWHLSR